MAFNVSFWITTISLMVVSMMAGILIGTAISPSTSSTYQDIAISTCQYANNLTDYVNLQSSIINKCTGLNQTQLGYLNCNQLR